MKIILFGYGSIGQRHAANLKALRPGVQLEIVDALKGYPGPVELVADGVIIATPTETHAELLKAWSGMPVYCEKPLAATEFQPYADHCAVGYQYRFHSEIPRLAFSAAKTEVLHFHARDDLLTRYGPHVGAIMAAHAIDLALWLFGPALNVQLASDGVMLRGSIAHERGHSTYDYRVDNGPRVSTVTSGKVFELSANNQMYSDALGAWLGWIETGRRDERTATLADGLAVDKVLAHV